MQEGIVKFFNEEIGFGFITPKGGGSEIFVNATGLTEKIQENDQVLTKWLKVKKDLTQ